MSRARMTTGLALAYVLALGATAACAEGDEKNAADAPPVDDPTRMLDAGVTDAPEPADVTSPTPSGCSPDGFCYVPVPSSKPLVAVSASSADDAWMLPQQSGALLRWNGKSIEQLYEYDGASPSSIIFKALSSAKKDDVWAAATSSEGHLFFVHYASRSEGATPTFRELPTETPDTSMRATWSSPAGDALWVAMENTVLRIREDASGAVVEDLRPSLGAEDEHGYAWRGIWGFGPDDVFAAGKVCPSSPCGGQGRGAIAHYDGTAWSITTLDSAADVSSLRGTPPGTDRHLWYDAAEETSPGQSILRTHLVTVTSSGQLGAALYTHVTTAPPACSTRLGQAVSASVGWFSSGGRLCRWNGKELVAARTSVDDRPVIGALNGIWAGGTEDVWLVGAAVMQQGLPQGAIAARRDATTVPATSGGER